MKTLFNIDNHLTFNVDIYFIFGILLLYRVEISHLRTYYVRLIEGKSFWNGEY